MLKARLLAALLFLTFPLQVLASALPDFPFVGVQGHAIKEVEPDTASVSFTILAFSEASDEALKTVQTRSADVIQLAQEFKLEQDEVISMGIDTQIKRDVNRDSGYKRTTILGYEVSQSFKLEITDLSNYSAFIDRLITLGNIDRIYPTFDVTNKKEIERELVAEAGKDARQQVDDLANAMGVKVKSVYAINQGKSFDYYFAKFGLQETVKVGGDVYASMAMGAPDRSMNMMVPKSIRVEKKVNVVYKIK